MTASRVEKALRSIAKRLTAIATPSFNTNAGTKVYIGRRSFAKTDCPCISVFLQNETPGPTSGEGLAGGSDYVSCKNRIQFGIEFHVATESQPQPVSSVIGTHPTGSGIDLQKLSADVKVAACNPAVLIDQEVVGLVTTDTKLGAIFWTGTEYQPIPEGATTESAVMTLQVDLVEAFGDPTVVSKPTP